MFEWAAAHPWMFFFLAAFALFVVWMLIANVCDVLKTRNVRASVEKLLKGGIIHEAHKN